jgi:hypothetical protein
VSSQSIRKRKRVLAIAHTDTPINTLRDVEIPTVVPLYVDANEGRQIGYARLRVREGRVYAALEPTFHESQFGDAEIVILGFEGVEHIWEKDRRYTVGGRVSCATLLTEDYISSLNSKEQK